MAADLIREAKTRWSELFNNGDVKGFAELYTEDCRVMAPNTPMMEGRDAFEKFAGVLIAAGMKAEVEPCKEIQTGTDDVKDGDTIWERGNSKLFNPNKPDVEQHLKYMVVWKKVDGSLKLDIEMWNANH